MRVPLSWLREYVDVELTPEQLAERLTLLGMEVKGIERWGADWRNVVVGELLDGREAPARRPAVADHASASGDGGSRSRSSAARRTSPPASASRSRCPAPSCPVTAASSGPRRWASSATGCCARATSSELTGDADGILILPADTPLGVAAGRPVRRRRPRRRRQAQPRRRALDRRAGPRGRGGDRRPVRFPPTDPSRRAGDPVAERLAVEVEDPTLCPRFVGRWVDGVTVGPSPDHVQMRLLAAGQRPISNVVDAQQLRDARARQADPHLRRARRSTDGADHRPARATAGERLETLDHVERELDPETLVIADPAGPIGIAGVMGGAGSEIGDATTDVVVESAIFDPVSIRRTAFRYALRSEASLRFEKGQEYRLARLGADRDGAAHRRVGGRPRSPPARWTRTRASPTPRSRRVPAGAHQPAARARTSPPTSSAASWRGSASTTEPSPAGHGDPGRARAPKPLVRRAGRRRRRSSRRSCRPGGATCRSRPTSPRRSPGSAATSVVPASCPHTPMPPYRPARCEVRDAHSRDPGRRRPDRGRHPRAGRRRRWSSASAARRPARRRRGGERPAGRAIRRHQPALQPALGPAPEPRSAASSRSSPPTSATAARTSPIFEVGKGYGALGETPTHEWWRLGVRADRRRPSRRPGTGRRGPPTSTTPRASLELLARRLGLAGPSYAAARPTTRTCIPGAPAAIARSAASRRPASASCIRRRRRARAPRRTRVVVAELAIARPGRRPAERPAGHDAVAPSRGRARPGGHRRRRRARRRRRGSDPRATAASSCARSALFDVYRGRPLADEREAASPTAWRSRADERTLTEAEVDAAIAAITAGLAADVGGRLRT